MKTLISALLACGPPAVMCRALAMAMPQPQPQVNTPVAIQSQGFIGNCQGFVPAAVGDTCSALAQREALSLDQFLAYNPQLGGEAGCSTNLLAGFWYCMKTIDAQRPGPTPPPFPPRPAPARGPDPAAPPATTTPAPPPSPPQSQPPANNPPPPPPPASPTPPPPPPPPSPATTPPPAPPLDCPVNACYGGFILAQLGAITAQSQFCVSYLGTINTEPVAASISGIPNNIKTCGAPAQLSQYCSCYGQGLLTAHSTRTP